MSVHCGYCYEVGHSRLHCKKMKEAAKLRPNSAAASQLEKYANSIKNRRCSYCKDKGHNKKSCSHLIGDLQVVKEVRNRWATVANNFVNKTVPIGSLFSRKTNTYSDSFLAYCTKHETPSEPRISFMDYDMLRQFMPISDQESATLKRYFGSDQILNKKERGKAIPGFVLTSMHPTEGRDWHGNRDTYLTIFDYNIEIGRGKLIPIDNLQNS